MKAIPKEVLDAEYRRLCRHIASALLAAMSEAEMGFPEIASDLGVSEKSLRRWFYRLMDGNCRDMREVCDLATAMGLRFRFSFPPIPKPAAETPE